MSSASTQQVATAALPPPLSTAASRPVAGHRPAFQVITLIVMVLYFVPFLLLRGDSYITIHDNLDGEFVTDYLLVATGTAFHGGTSIPNIMNGLPRAALPAGLNITVLLFYIFSPPWAYIVNFILVHVLAFLGMFLLLRKHFLTENRDYLIAGAVAICFFLVPYYTIYGLTVAGQPLLAYAFLNIRRGQLRWVDYLVIVLFPLWSNMPLVAPFAVSVLILVMLVDWARSRSLNGRFVTAILLFVGVYLALQYQLIYSILGSSTWVSHRTTWNRWTDFHLRSNAHRALEMLLNTQYHTGSFSSLPIIATAGVAFLLLIARKRRPGLLDVIAIGIALICLEYGFYDWIVRWLGRLVPGLQSFNAGRYYFLLPLLWMLLFALSLKEVSTVRWGTLIVSSLLLLQMFSILKFDTEVANSARLLVGKHVYEPSFNRFFAKDLFAEMDQFIGKPKSSYRVVSVGMHPSVAQFNGFYTLDGYLTNYSLAYKNQFRKIMATELSKDAYLKDYFDGWGNRCYVFSGELHLNHLCSADGHYVLHDLQLDTKQLRLMGCEYLISAAYIENNAQLGLKLEKQFSSPGSFWHLYLYYVLPATAARVAPIDHGADGPS